MSSASLLLLKRMAERVPELVARSQAEFRETIFQIPMQRAAALAAGAS